MAANQWPPRLHALKPTSRVLSSPAVHHRRPLPVAHPLAHSKRGDGCHENEPLSLAESTAKTCSMSTSRLTPPKRRVDRCGVFEDGQVFERAGFEEVEERKEFYVSRPHHGCEV